MSGKAFVDTNVFVYAHDPRGTAKSAQARALIRQLWLEKRGILSTQVLQEFCVNVRRKFLQPMSSEESGDLLHDYMKWQTVVNTAESIVRALEIERRYQLSFWDAMIVQAAASAGCEVLYSEDLSHGQEYQGVLVINPFVN